MPTDKKLWRNRKERKEWARRLQSEDPGLEVVHPRAAGIDVGNSAHYVAVRPERDPQPVRRFECFTADLHRLADWLQGCGVKTVAMQSTGVYWIPLYDILEERGFEVYLVNARHTKNLPGRKSDVQESQWLLKLHTYGLLNNSFQPPVEIRALRTYWRQRAEHVRGAATCIQRIQKALTQMNLQLANVISNISGLTGQAIIRAIVAGERDPQKLATFRDPRIQANEEEIAKSLEGTWRPELLFVVQQQLEMYDTYQRRIAECDQQLQRHLASLPNNVPCQPTAASEGKKAKKAKPAKNAPRFDLSCELQRITGVDLTRIDGIDVMIAQTLLSEVGADMSRWKTEAHFASWLGLCPDNRVSGDKVLRRGTRHVVNRAANALRQAANALIRSRSYLGAQYRRLRTKLGAPKAITAMAHRLARLKGIVFTMPRELWPIFQQNRHLLHDLPTIGADVIQEWAKDRYGVRLIVVVVPHTFARDLNFNCHLHVLVSAGGLHESQNRWIPSLYYHRDTLMKRWRDALTGYLLEALAASVLESELSPKNLEELLKAQGKRWWNIRVQGSQTKEHFLGYACRYVRHPPIAQRRITRVTNREVEFWKKDLKLHRRVNLRYSIEEFVAVLADHVPDHYRHAIRYFGLWAPGSKAKTSAAVFALLRQYRRSRPRRLSWRQSLLKYFAEDPLIDSHGQCMHWVRRLQPCFSRGAG